MASSVPNDRWRSGAGRLVCAVLLVCVWPFAAIASDRDTPAYRIYVDPVTGRYSTRPPEESNAPATRESGANLSGPQTPASAIAPPEPDIRRPLKAVFVLIGIASVSLVARAFKSGPLK